MPATTSFAFRVASRVAHAVSKPANQINAQAARPDEYIALSDKFFDPERLWLYKKRSIASRSVKVSGRSAAPEFAFFFYSNVAPDVVRY